MCRTHHTFNILIPRQNDRHFPDIFNLEMSIQISLKFVPYGSINNNPALGQIMAWRQLGDKPLFEPMMA